MSKAAQEAWAKLKKVVRGPQFHLTKEEFEALDKALAPKKSVMDKVKGKDNAT
jgi:hypothetical protein